MSYSFHYNFKHTPFIFDWVSFYPTALAYCAFAVLLWFSMSKATKKTTLAELYKSQSDKKIAGVCGGLGAITKLASWGWRIVFLLAFPINGIGLYAYLVLVICLPKQVAKIAEVDGISI